MTKIQNWPLWLQQLVEIPHIPIMVWLLVRTSKTRKGWYFAYGFMVYMVIFGFVFMR